jgi:hypothetical protein
MAKGETYPGASRDHWYQDKYPGDAMDTNVVVWHTTEGRTLPDYDGGATAPNFTAVPDFRAKKLVWHQHFNVDVSARALKNKPGGVETNTMNACQVELVGTSDPVTHGKWSAAHLYTPELPDWVIRDLAAFAKWMRSEHGVPLTSGVSFKPYPDSYGDNGVRMSGAKWSAFRGHCGHQHVPENDHGDPGWFPMARILALASKPAAPKPPATPPGKPAGKPVVWLSHLIGAAKRDPSGAQGATTYKAEVLLVEKALVALGYLDKRWADGSFGLKTRDAFGVIQHHLGYTGDDANGIPGKHSLTWLALKSQTFRVGD